MLTYVYGAKISKNCDFELRKKQDGTISVEIMTGRQKTHRSVVLSENTLESIISTYERAKKQGFNL